MYTRSFVLATAAWAGDASPTVVVHHWLTCVAAGDQIGRGEEKGTKWYSSSSV
jgi:hypothetical protein